MHGGRVLAHALGVVLLLAQHRDHRLGAGDHLPRREVGLGDSYWKGGHLILSLTAVGERCRWSRS